MRPVEMGSSAEQGSSSSTTSGSMAIARAMRDAAELVLWLRPADASPGTPAPEGAVEVTSRTDLGPPRSGPALSALRDPEAAVAVLEDVFRARFDLPADAWTPGAPAAFEPEIQRGLVELLGEDDPGVRRDALDELLGR